MSCPRASFDVLLAATRAGRLSRRQALERGLRLGLATPAVAALVAAAPAQAEAAPRPGGTPERLARFQAGGSTFTVLRDGSAPDIDPHSAYDNLASMLFFGLYEMLLPCR
jgi:hypothetical protein